MSSFHFEGILKYPLIFSISLLVVLFTTPFVIRIATALGAVDKVGPRRINKVPIPRGGGVAVFLGFHLGCLALFAPYWSNVRGIITFNWWLIYFCVSLFILVVGIIDDLRGLSPLTKLIAQVLGASFLFFIDVRFGKVVGIELPPLIDFCASVFWVLSITNAFNLIDGLDGLASGLAAIGALGLSSSLIFRNAPGDALVMLALAGALLGFLKFNFHPASIFLGDCGSLFIGFTLAALSLATASKGTMIASMGVPLLALGVPIFDTSLAVWRRSVRKFFPEATGRPRGTGVMQVDMDHLHHRLLRSGFDQKRAAVALYTANAALVTVGMLSLLYSSRAGGIFLVAFVVGAYIITRHVAHVELWDSGSAFLAGISRPQPRVMMVLIAPIVDLIGFIATLGLVLGISGRFISFNDWKVAFIQEVPLWCTLPFLTIAASRTYTRVWSRSRPSDFARLALSVVAGCLLAAGVSSIFSGGRPSLTVEEIALFCLASVVGITGARALPRLVQDILGLYGGEPLKGKKRIAVYGAGSRGLLFLHGQVRDIQIHAGKVVALIDDDRNLRKRLIHGFRVAGGFRDLATLVRKGDIDEIILTTELPEKRLRRLIALGERYGIALVEWVPRRKVLTPASLTEATPSFVSETISVNEEIPLKRVGS
jgi:UDP-GlcNAc:undecaprenyl-phosphate/decaprenyl-phosphate GlcNAc-1-phosphate transferase